MAADMQTNRQSDKKTIRQSDNQTKRQSDNQTKKTNRQSGTIKNLFEEDSFGQNTRCFKRLNKILAFHKKVTAMGE